MNPPSSSSSTSSSIIVGEGGRPYHVSMTTHLSTSPPLSLNSWLGGIIIISSVLFWGPYKHLQAPLSSPLCAPSNASRCPRKHLYAPLSSPLCMPIGVTMRPYLYLYASMCSCYRLISTLLWSSPWSPPTLSMES